MQILPVLSFTSLDAMHKRLINLGYNTRNDAQKLICRGGGPADHVLSRPTLSKSPLQAFPNGSLCPKTIVNKQDPKFNLLLISRPIT